MLSAGASLSCRMSRHLLLRPTALTAALFVLSFAGCATAPRTTMLGPARPAITGTEGVRVYHTPPKRFQEIALVEGRSLAELRSRAAAVGANGILPGGVVQKPGPVIGVGIGGGSYHFGRRSAYGVETGASFGIPTGGSVMEATAIYVP